MQDYTIQLPGFYDEVLRPSYGSPLTHRNSLAGQVRNYIALTVISDNKAGNFKTPNAHTFRKDVYTSARGVRIVKDPSTGYYQSITGDIVSVSGSRYNPVDLSTMLYNQVLSDINEKIRGSLDLSIDFAEAGKTKKMIRDAFHVVELARNLRRKFGFGIGDVWLQYQYGWRPLVNSIYDTVDELCSKGLNRSLLVTVESRRKLHLDGSVGLSYPLPGQLVHSTDYRVLMKIRLKNGSLSTGVSNYTSLNPASIAWELLPYSFVVDWFYNVGGYLRNLETAMIYGNVFHSGFWTYGYKSEQTALVKGVALNSPTTIYNATGSARRTYKSRAVLTSYPSPRKPVLNLYSLGSTRLLSAAALLSQFLGAKKR